MSIKKVRKRIAAYRRMWELKRIPLSTLHAPASSELDVIVSLTTIPSRLGTVGYTVLSLLSQRQPPKKVVLWLHNSLKGRVPRLLDSLQGSRFDILFTEFDSSHCKLVPTLVVYPNEVIVTCDDDEMYSPVWLQGIWSAHQRSPSKIVAYRTRVVTKDNDGNLINYKQWGEAESDAELEHSIPLGYAGVLYPARCLNEAVTQENKYMALCPKADDLWFKAMGYLAGTKIALASVEEPFMISLPGTQKISLRHDNIREDRNRTQWQALCHEYPQLNELGILRI